MQKVLFDTELYSIFKVKGVICQMVPFVTKYCIVCNHLVEAKCVICHVTLSNSQYLLQCSHLASNRKVLCDM